MENEVPKIRILNPSIDDYQKTVVIRSVLDNDDLNLLKTDFYQRELLPSTSRKYIREAIISGARLPDVVLGMRGETFEMDKKVLLLVDPVFIIDGQQRIKTLIEMLADARKIRLGAVIHLNTIPDFERDLFQKLNQFQVKVSSNILLRNVKEDHPLIATMYGLTKSDKTFILYDRVSWLQNMKRNDLLSATTMLYIIMRLHSHISPGRNTGLPATVPATDKLISRIGLPNTRANIKTFFDLVDSCWGIKRIQIKGGAPYMRRPFLEVLAHILSDHTDFWKGEKEQKLFIDYTIKRKLSSFPISDPEIIRLAAATGAAKVTLYTHIVNHINSGKRTQRLTSRKPSITFNLEELEDENENENAA
jgi:hypothetical protein